MKQVKIILAVLIFCSSFSSLQAQKGRTSLNINYAIAMPTGSFKDQVSATSFRGYQASVLYGISNHLSVGLGTGFQDFYQKYPRQLYKLNDGSDASAVLTYSIQTIPILATAKYNFMPDNFIQPYAALGVGGNAISYNQLLGEFGNTNTKFGFAARPEAGVYVPFKKYGEAGFTVGASYNIMPFNQDGFTNLNNLGIHAGIKIPLRK